MTKFDYCLAHLIKEADEKKGKFPYGRVAKIIGTGALGAGLGYAVGDAAARGAGRLAGPRESAELARKIGPVAGAALGVAYPLWKMREQKEIADAVESARNQAK